MNIQRIGKFRVCHVVVVVDSEAARVRGLLFVVVGVSLGDFSSSAEKSALQRLRSFSLIRHYTLDHHE